MPKITPIFVFESLVKRVPVSTITSLPIDGVEHIGRRVCWWLDQVSARQFARALANVCPPMDPVAKMGPSIILVVVGDVITGQIEYI